MIRTFIYGSCVSRDTFEFLDPDLFSLTRYVARQSIISAMSPAASTPIPAFETRSSFQRRMLTGDWDSSLVTDLRNHRDHIDLLLWDLCDERLGLRDLASHNSHGILQPHATRSVDSIRSGLDSALSTYPVIPFGTVRHRLRFNRAVDTFVTLLNTLGLADRTIVISPPWARNTETGRRVPPSLGLSPQRANRIYAGYLGSVRYYSSFPIVSLPEISVHADPEHRWGIAPFHYTPENYVRLAEQILSHVTPRRSG